MSQHDYIISNDTGANVRSDLNNALGAIATINSGATEPSTTYAYQLWMDTSSNVLKIRNSANSAWYTLPISPIANNTVDINGGTIDGVTLGASSAITSAVITSADINGGTIDGVTIGGSSAGAITGTTITGTSFVTSGDMTFGDNDKAIFGAGSDLQIYHDGTTNKVVGSINVTGTVTADGLTVSTATGSATIDPSEIIIKTETVASDWSTSDDWGRLVFYSDDTSNGGAKAHATIGTSATATGGGLSKLVFKTSNSTPALVKRMDINEGGDISFYEDTGTTAKFFWDASAESLGIGTSSHQANHGLTVKAPASNYAQIALIGGDSSNYWSLQTLNTSAAAMFSYNGSEKMRIDSSGNLLVGTTDLDLGYTDGDDGVVIGASGTIAVARSATTGGHLAYFNKLDNTGNLIYFAYNGSEVGEITITASSTSYNTSSDYRLKTDVQPMTGATERLKALNPVNFAWKVDGSRVDGFLAHEAAEVVPEAVTGTKDAVEAIGNITDAEGTVVQENVTEPAELAEGQTWTKTEDRPVYQGIDQSKLTPLLTAALQDTLALVEAQAAKIEALETRIAALEA